MHVARHGVARMQPGTARHACSQAWYSEGPGLVSAFGAYMQLMGAPMPYFLAHLPAGLHVR